MNEQYKTPTWKILLPGIPVTSTRGALGWSSVTLIQMENHNLLVDTGSYGDRAQLLNSLASANISPDDINGILLTHFHFDHMLNFDLFPNAAIYLSRKEIDYASKGGCQKAADPFVPTVLYGVLEERIKPFSGEIELLPGIGTIPLPGHTPGMTGFLLQEEKVLIAGDGIKNGYEFSRGLPPPSFASEKQSLESYKKIVDVADIVIPGHDNPFRIPIKEKVCYLDNFSLEIQFAGDPSKEPTAIKLP